MFLVSSSGEWNILNAIVRKLSAVWLNQQKESGSYFWRYDHAAPSSCRNPTASSWYTPGLAVDDHNAKSDEERPTILTSPNFINIFIPHHKLFPSDVLFIVPTSLY